MARYEKSYRDNVRSRQVAPWQDGWPEIYEPRVRAAFAKVSRGGFVAPDLRQWAEHDAPLPIGEGQTVSQPFVIALMVQALRLQPGDRVLEIGTGSGYQTAILCELTMFTEDEQGASVWSIERYPELAREAADALAHLGYYPHLSVGDGAVGWPEGAPYTGIVVSAAAPALPKPLWDQLADGGRIMIPIGSADGEQILWLVEKRREYMLSRKYGPVRFVPLVSPVFDDPEQCLAIRQ